VKVRLKNVLRPVSLCPALHEVMTFGENEEDAKRHAADAIEEALAVRIADGTEIPRIASSYRTATGSSARVAPVEQSDAIYAPHGSRTSTPAR
jgi:hypothetical protein